MSEEQQVPAPEGTTEPTTQPQAAPATPETPPEGGQVEGQPQMGQPEGTTDTKAQTEQFYQTKYQEALNRLNQFEQMYGPIDQQQPDEQPQPEPPEPEPEPEDENGLWMHEVAKRSGDYAFQKVKSYMETQQKQAMQQQQKQQELAYANRELGTWAQTNQVPDDVLRKNIQKVESEIPNARPVVQAKYVMQNIINEAYSRGQNEQLAQLQAQAATKGKELAGAEQPAPGQPPSPGTSQESTPAQQWADDIAPDDPEPNFN